MAGRRRSRQKGRKRANKRAFKPEVYNAMSEFGGRKKRSASAIKAFHLGFTKKF